METPAPKILHVDDREENRYIAGRILRAAGFEVAEARTGVEGLEKSLESPDLIILDIKLPDMLGYEVCRRIRANPATAKIPVLHLSATFVTGESRVHALEGGADSYLTWPVEPPVLVSTIRSLLRLGHAEEISRVSAKQWQSTFDALTDGVALVDVDGRILRCNRAFVELTGSRFEQAIGGEAATLLAEGLGVAPGQQAQLDGPPVEVMGNARRWYRMSARAVVRPDSRDLGGWIAVVADITDRKRSEEVLRLNEKLIATGRLAHSIAHEINNPLAALTNLLYLARQGTAGPTAEYLKSAQAELERVSLITKQTLAFHRETRTPQPVEISGVLEDILQLLAARIHEKNVEVRQMYETRAKVCVFPGEIRQVFSNLMANAIEALPEGGQLTLHVVESRDWHDHERAGVRVTIADNGPGIPEEVKSRIFDAFFTTKELKGSGLGLWLTRGIIAKHGGTIRFRSRQRNGGSGLSGTIFSVFLPQDDVVTSVRRMA